ncbi:MAG: HEAT repeat domain-containing protein [Bythopirellula sp.]|nr:HEAT repeat domain-containing protein [Bythopirellula sp.]
MEVATSQFRALLVRLILLSGLVVVMLAAAPLLWPPVSGWQERRLANRLVAELQQAESADSSTALRQIASLGDPAIEALVIAATSARADIALSAREIVDEKLAAWKSLHETDKSFSISVPAGLLANALAGHIDEFGPLGQQWSTKLAVELADLAAELSPAEAMALLADCSLILEKVPPVGPRLRTITQENPVAASEQTRTPALNLPALPSEQAISSRNESSPLSASTDPLSVGDVLDSPEIANSTPLPSVSDWLPEWSGKVPSMNAQPTEIPGLAPAKTQAQSFAEAVDVPSPDDMAARVEKFKPLATRELITELGKTDYFSASAIRAVLRERGITPEELSLAAKLTASDPAERLLLVDDLKVLPARTARRWLREMLADSDAEVRLKALTALATTKDPELVGVVRDLALRESDPRVSALAARIMREAR